jgi:hypothetical protein
VYAIKSSFEGLFLKEQLDEEEMAMELNFNSDGETPSYIQYTIDSVIDYWLMEQEYATVLNISTLILALASLIGVLLMYRLNKKGFIVYSSANLLGVIIPFFYFLNNTVGQLFIATQFFVSALFILLYASQLKYMNANKEPLKL